MNASMKEAAEQLLKTIATSRAKLTERLERWDSLTASALVGEQWVVCTPLAMATYKLITLRQLGDGQAMYESQICHLADAPLYSEEHGQKVLEVQRSLRVGQELILMHIREAIITTLEVLDDQEVSAKEFLTRTEREAQEAMA